LRIKGAGIAIIIAPGLEYSIYSIKVYS
jgi:hypothetical protein